MAPALAGVLGACGAQLKALGELVQELAKDDALRPGHPSLSALQESTALLVRELSGGSPPDAIPAVTETVQNAEAAAAEAEKARKAEAAAAEAERAREAEMTSYWHEAEKAIQAEATAAEKARQAKEASAAAERTREAEAAAIATEAEKARKAEAVAAEADKARKAEAAAAEAERAREAEMTSYWHEAEKAVQAEATAAEKARQVEAEKTSQAQFTAPGTAAIETHVEQTKTSASGSLFQEAEIRQGSTGLFGGTPSSPSAPASTSLFAGAPASPVQSSGGYPDLATQARSRLMKRMQDDDGPSTEADEGSSNLPAEAIPALTPGASAATAASDKWTMRFSRQESTQVQVTPMHGGPEGAYAREGDSGKWNNQKTP